MHFFLSIKERRKQWEDEFERMRSDFFTLKPSEKAPQALASVDLDTGIKSMFETEADGSQKFKVRFDVSEFKPEEIQVSVKERLSVQYRSRVVTNLSD